MALFKYIYGKLPYRSLKFVHEYHDCDHFLPREIISYPQADGFTRSTEYKRFNFHCENKKKTVVVTEYPIDYNPENDLQSPPCYPIITEKNMELYNKYKKESLKYKNLVLCGRLAEYKYYNMDLVIESTFKTFEMIKDLLEKEK